MMRIWIDRVSLKLFDLLAFSKGFSFKEVKTERELADFQNLTNGNSSRLPDTLHKMVAEYDKGCINFIAYYLKSPIGSVRLSNPKIKNRPYELFGLDETAECFEIQNLMVKENHRDGAQFVMMGLFKAMYQYSLNNSVRRWISGSTWGVYRTMQRYNKNIQVLEQKNKMFSNPVARYVYANNIVDLYYTMEVMDFSPAVILKKIIKRLWKQRAFLPGLRFCKLKTDATEVKVTPA